MEGVKYRSDLLTLLSEACELEHGVACSYLYSAFSIKNAPEEFAPEQHQKIRSWSKQSYEVAKQEMLHLAQVANTTSPQSLINWRKLRYFDGN